MQIVVAPDREAIGRFVSERAAEILRDCLANQESCHLVVATGSSQFEVLDNLVQQPDIDWRRVHGFHLDEYLGIAQDHSASFVGYLKSRFADKLPLASFFFMDGLQPAAELQREASAAIAGKDIDLLLCGIGENGHLAFNDPPANFDASEPYLIVELDEACRRQQVGEGWFDSLTDVPTQAISMSIRQIMSAKRILCTVPDRRKAEAVRDTVEGSVTPQVPASILQQHPQTTLILDASSSSLLTPNTLATCQHLESSN
ncbi:MAG: glucosamine-6-phosphate deaminase [Pirellulaceae bacterium]